MLLDLTIDRTEIESQFLAEDVIQTTLVLVGEEWDDDDDVTRTARIELTKWDAAQTQNTGAVTLHRRQELSIQMSISSSQFSYFHELLLRRSKDQELLMHLELPDDLKVDDSVAWVPFFQVTLASDSGGAV